MAEIRGSVWRKWDLHVHTPESIAATGYRASEAESAWEKYLSDLEALAPEFKVIGINDYIFIDGYRKVLEEKKKGRLSNIDLILPVIELRIDKFGGTNSDLSKVNLHIIFSNEIEPEIIQQHFLNALPSKYTLTPKYEHLKGQWNALATYESLAELGNLIINSAPIDKREEYSSPKLEGFNNINFNIKAIEKVLESHYFKDKYLLAVGKTEWANIKWNDQSIADKKTIINSVDMVFTSAQSIPMFYTSKKSLTESNVNDKLLDCSDAHHFSNTKEKDRIGKCFTWIKSDCTFKGLKLALFEATERVFIGEKPEKLNMVENNKTRYIRSIEINKIPNTMLAETWFSGSKIDLNPGLIAIIGNKGSGKSALADVIALLGNAKSQPYSFLTDRKFRDKKNNNAKHFTANLTWESGAQKLKNLGDDVISNEIELVKYIPQQFLENICNEIGTDQDLEFDKELKKVIFSHVDEANRLKCDSLESLINYKTSETNKAIANLQLKLSEINKQYAMLEYQSTSSLLEIYKSKLQQKQNELEENEKIVPPIVEKPILETEASQEVAATSTEINSKTDKREIISEEIKSKVDDQKIQNIKISTILRVQQKIENFKKVFETFKNDLNIDLIEIGLDFDSVMRFALNTTEVTNALTKTQLEKAKIDLSLDINDPNSLWSKKNALEKEIKELQDKLDEPNRLYQNYLKELGAWTNKKHEIIGEIDRIDTLKYYEFKIDEITNIIPGKLKLLRERAFGISEEIYDEILKLKREYEDFYKPVQTFTENNVIVKNEFKLKFEVSIVIQGFSERFFDIISNGAKGTFYGVREGTEKLDDIINSFSYDEKTKAISFINVMLDSLISDKREGKGTENSIQNQLRKGIKSEDLYDYLFSLEYLKPKYELKLGNRDLSKLSPGEKGLLLLMFYLLIDKEEIPLVIDQPEENLDNESIVGLLVPCIKAAKKKRQIIMVTHNPNLAVVCDAEQVICTQIVRKNDITIKYSAGSIEDIIINKNLVDVLEGTCLAFNNRDEKYYSTKNFKNN